MSAAARRNSTLLALIDLAEERQMAYPSNDGIEWFGARGWYGILCARDGRNRGYTLGKVVQALLEGERRGLVRINGRGSSDYDVLSYGIMTDVSYGAIEEAEPAEPTVKVDIEQDDNIGPSSLYW